MLTVPFSPSTGRVPRPRASGVAVAGPWHEKSERSRTGHRARSRFSRVGPRRPTASSHDQPGRSHPDPESRSARKHSSPSGAEYAARYAPQESDSDFVSCQASVYKNTTSRAPRLPGSRRRQDQEPEAKFGRLARLRPIHGFNSRWQNPRGVRPAIHPGQTTGSETHAAFGRRSIPAEPRRFAPLIVAFRSKYTRASSPSGGSSLTRLVSRAPRPHRENWPVSALTWVSPQAAGTATNSAATCTPQDEAVGGESKASVSRVAVDRSD